MRIRPLWSCHSVAKEIFQYYLRVGFMEEKADNNKDAKQEKNCPVSRSHFNLSVYTIRLSREKVKENG